MYFLIFIVLLMVISLVAWKFFRSRNNGTHTITIPVNDIEKVYRQISTQGVETSFAVFIITSPKRTPENTVEIQFSVEEGVTGLDWILVSESNKREKPRVIQYGSSQGIDWQQCEMNNWVYLRTEQGDLVDLCTSLIRDLYEAEDVLLKYGGFKYYKS